MISIYNTLTKVTETIVSEKQQPIGIYTCGPTVYRRSHIGNLRSYLMSDWLRRAIEGTGTEVFHIKNITDVGHMRQERVDLGEDKILAAAIAAGRSPKEIADEYTAMFFSDETALGIIPADVYPRATEHIPEMISMIQQLITGGFAYVVDGAVYFSVDTFGGYGKLSGNLANQLLRTIPSEIDHRKQDLRDFALWKEAEPGRSMKWDSPWGPGFPGWHIECSAMAGRYLGSSIDVHTGGVDNIFPHHECEIAQSEAIYQQRHTNIWMHGQHLLVDGIKMAKSSQNDYTLDQLQQRGFDPMAFRYLCATVRYRSRLNFTLKSLDAAQKGLFHFRKIMDSLDLDSNVSAKDLDDMKRYRTEFAAHIQNDLNLPSGLATAWAVIKSDMSGAAKLILIGEFDKVLGLQLTLHQEEQFPEEVSELSRNRIIARRNRDWVVADELRDRLRDKGIFVEDMREGSNLRMLHGRELIPTNWTCISGPNDLVFSPETTTSVDVSMILVNTDCLQDTIRCVDSISSHSNRHSVEIVIVQNGMREAVDAQIEEIYRDRQDVTIVHIESQIGDSRAKNAGVCIAQGKNLMIMDSSVEVTGDFIGPILMILEDTSVGIVGPWGLLSKDLKEFEEKTSGKVDAMQAYCLAFRRDTLEVVGLLDEGFRFYRHSDLEYSFRFKYHQYAIVAQDNLPMVRHVHREWERLSEEERELLSTANFKKFLRAWGHHHDLLEINSGQ
jgi:cysteinyl-tRNA synthetase